MWLCIRLNKAGKWAYDRLKEDNEFGKKITFSYEAHCNLGGYVNKEHRKPARKTTQNVSMFGTDFDPEV